MATTTIHINNEENKKEKASLKGILNESLKGAIKGKSEEDIILTADPFSSSSDDQNQHKATVCKNNLQK